MPSGRSVPIPYNGSVARLSFGPMSYTRVRRWIRAGQFDVLHVHEPVAPSLSMLALMVADGPIVATFHTANPRSRMLAAFQGVLQPFLEKITGRIAVSELGPPGAGRAPRRRRGDHPQRRRRAVLRRRARRCPAIRGPAAPSASSAGSTSRARAWRCCSTRCGRSSPERPDLQLLVAGSGDEKDLREEAGPELAAHAAVPRPGVRRGQGVDAPIGRRVLRAEHRRGELRHHPHRGDERRNARSWPAISTRSAGCWTAASPAC